MASFSSQDWNTAAAALFFDSSFVVVVVAVAVPPMAFITSFLPLAVMKYPVFASRMIKEGIPYDARRKETIPDNESMRKPKVYFVTQSSSLEIKTNTLTCILNMVIKFLLF